MKKFLVVIWILAIAAALLPVGIIGILAVLAAISGYVAGARYREEIVVSGFIGASVVLFGHVLPNAFLIISHPLLGLHTKQEEAGAAHLFGALIFSAIMPGTILGGVGAISGYIGRRFSKA